LIFGFARGRRAAERSGFLPVAMTPGQRSGMPLKSKTKLQIYADAPNNHSRFMKGIMMGIGTGLVVVLICLALAYALDLDGIQPMIDEIFRKITHTG
jgi:hypothetical protein